MHMPSLAKIEQPPATLRDIVQDRIRDAIIEGILPPGQRLVERPLCEQLGVSRTVIRETIRFLEAEGLVDTSSGRGPRVAMMTRDDARQIYEIRRVLETAAAETCARRITPARAQTLQSAFDNMARAQKTNAPADHLRAAAAFYAEIFEGAGHHIAWEIVQRLNGRISRLRMMTLSHANRTQPGLAHMEAICAAILSGAPEAARAAVTAHVTEAAAIADHLLARETEEAET